MSPKENILCHTIEYFKIKIPNFKINKTLKLTLFTCPICQKPNTSALIIQNTHKIRCNICNKIHGTLIDVIRKIDTSLEQADEDTILRHVRDTLKLEIKTEEEIDRALQFYSNNGFDLVPVAKNQKIPIELKWTEKNHKNIEEWKVWLSDGLNFGIKTGELSNVIILDLDQEKIPEELVSLISPTLTQKTQRGTQWFYKYDSDIYSTRIDTLKLDILSSGKQAVLYPSIVNNHSRSIELKEIAPLPIKLKEFLKSHISVPLKSFSEKIKEEIQTETINLENSKSITEGGRNSFLLSFGGILRKELNINQTSYTLNLINRFLCSPPLPMRELDNIVGSLDKYAHVDNQDLAFKILQYMKVVESANSKDIAEALGEKGAEAKQRLEAAINYLVKEGFLLKKGRIYFIVRKAEWKETFMEDGQLIDFKMPYFDNYAIFRDSDMLVIGGRPGSGKTHLALSIVKKLVEQGKKPYYISLEAGNRHAHIARVMGLKEGDYKYCLHYNPQHISLEKNAITLIDWLLPNDYAETDKLYKHFAEELAVKNGILIVFAQLNTNNEFFAKNLIEFFPAFVTKFLYEDDSGVNSYFQITKIREPKGHFKVAKIPTIYDFAKKELNLVEEIKENK